MSQLPRPEASYATRAVDSQNLDIGQEDWMKNFRACGMLIVNRAQGGNDFPNWQPNAAQQAALNDLERGFAIAES